MTSTTNYIRRRRNIPTSASACSKSAAGLQEIRHAILGHAEYTGTPRVSHLDKVLFASDELAGFLTACALIKPSKSIHDVEVAGVRKKLKDKAFARGVNREDVINGATEFGDRPRPTHRLLPRRDAARRGGARIRWGPGFGSAGALMLQSLTCGGLLVAIAALELLCASASAQQSAITTQVLGRIDSRRSSEGGSFFVKTTSAWKQGRCTIPNGSTLEGRIAKVRKKGSGVKREELDLRFLEIPCSGDEAQQILPILVAMQGPHHDPRADFIMQQQLVGALAGGLRRLSTDSSGAASSSPGAAGNMAGSTGHLGNLSPTSSNEQPFRAAEALGFPGVELKLPVLTTDPTTLSASSQLLIDPGTRFRLVLQMAPRPAAADSPSAERAVIARPVSEPAAAALKQPVKQPVKKASSAGGSGKSRDRKLRRDRLRLCR